MNLNEIDQNAEVTAVCPRCKILKDMPAWRAFLLTACTCCGQIHKPADNLLNPGGINAVLTGDGKGDRR